MSPVQSGPGVGYNQTGTGSETMEEVKARTAQIRLRSQVAEKTDKARKKAKQIRKQDQRS